MTGFTFFLNIHFDGRLEHSVKGDKKGSTKKQVNIAKVQIRNIGGLD